MNLICPNCDGTFYGWDGHTRTFCSWACRYAYARRRDVIESRFWSNVDVRGEDECWLWTGCFFATGYGQFDFILSTKMHKVKATRFMWLLTHGSISRHLEICHDCPVGDNPACVNPNHLFLGTQYDNMQDMVAKGRSNYGERNGKVKLTEAQVLEVYALRKAGWTQQSIADRFEVSWSTIHLIVIGKNWKHLHPANRG